MPKRTSPATARRTAIDRIADSWCRRNRPESMNTDWGQTLLAYGLASAVRATGNERAREYLRRWITYHLGAGVHVTYFVGSWGIGLLIGELAELFPEYALPLERTAERIYDFIRTKAIRNGRGVILHNVDLPHVYVDTVYYTAPVLARLGALLGRDEWRDDAIAQLDAHLEILRDPASGFSVHCEENLSGHRSEGAWARGNGWIAMTCAELIPHLPARSAAQRHVQQIMTDLMSALAGHQTRGGLWRTIIDDRSAYEEVSATAMYLFALTRGVRNGWLAPTFTDAVLRAERAIHRHIDVEGRLMGVSEGTWPGTIAYYKGLDRGEWWWGTGAGLLALAEIADETFPG